MEERDIPPKQNGAVADRATAPMTFALRWIYFAKLPMAAASVGNTSNTVTSLVTCKTS